MIPKNKPLTICQKKQASSPENRYACWVQLGSVRGYQVTNEEAEYHYRKHGPPASVMCDIGTCDGHCIATNDLFEDDSEPVVERLSSQIRPDSAA